MNWKPKEDQWLFGGTHKEGENEDLNMRKRSAQEKVMKEFNILLRRTKEYHAQGESLEAMLKLRSLN